jgi:hypothetical protein
MPAIIYDHAAIRAAMPSILEEPMTPVAQHVVQPMAVETESHIAWDQFTDENGC